MVIVVPNGCEFAVDNSRGTIMLESDELNFPAAIGELQANEARNIALGYAATKGVPDPRINGMVPHPYPVNEEGCPLDRVLGPDGKQLPHTHPKMRPARYRTDVAVTRRLV